MSLEQEIQQYENDATFLDYCNFDNNFGENVRAIIFQFTDDTNEENKECYFQYLKNINEYRVVPIEMITLIEWHEIENSLSFCEIVKREFEEFKELYYEIKEDTEYPFDLIAEELEKTEMDDFKNIHENYVQWKHDFEMYRTMSARYKIRTMREILSFPLYSGITVKDSDKILKIMHHFYKVVYDLLRKLDLIAQSHEFFVLTPDKLSEYLGEDNNNWESKLRDFLMIFKKFSTETNVFLVNMIRDIIRDTSIRKFILVAKVYYFVFKYNEKIFNSGGRRMLKYPQINQNNINNERLMIEIIDYIKFLSDNYNFFGNGEEVPPGDYFYVANDNSILFNLNDIVQEHLEHDFLKEKIEQQRNRRERYLSKTKKCVKTFPLTILTKEEFDSIVEGKLSLEDILKISDNNEYQRFTTWCWQQANLGKEEKYENWKQSLKRQREETLTPDCPLCCETTNLVHYHAGCSFMLCQECRQQVDRCPGCRRSATQFGKKPRSKTYKGKTYKGYNLVSIKKSTNSGKKLMATFKHNTTGRTKTIHFGAAGMSDYTKHKDPHRKQRYINRHRKRENWNNPMTAGALSLHILWNKPTLKASIADYKKRFF